jgi:small subunit ribosomal protein S31
MSMVRCIRKKQIFQKILFVDLSSKISPIWEKYEQDELTRISSIPPRNAFEEMIQWTKDGILWKFPIDNEQG